MFTSNGFQDSKSVVTEEKEFSKQTVGDFLKYLYCEQLLKEEFTPELLLMAEKYDVKKLIQDCSQELMKGLDSENVLDILKVAFLVNQDCLMIKARTFLFKNPSIFISHKWGQMIQTHPSLCDTLLNDTVQG